LYILFRRLALHRNYHRLRFTLLFVTNSITNICH
jgi:hypothetical protein